MGLQWVILHEIQRVQSQPATDLAVLLSFLGNYSTYMYLTAIMMWWYGEKRGNEIALLLFCTMGLTDLLKAMVHSTRPIGVHGIISKYTESAAGASFPSGHAMVSTVFWEYLARCCKRTWRIVMLFVPIAIGLSRLYLGVHWPIDVVAGWVLGSAIVLLPLPKEALWGGILLILTFTPLVYDTALFGRFVATCWILFTVWPWQKRLGQVRKLMVGTIGFVGLIGLSMFVPRIAWMMPFASGIWVQVVGTMI